MKNTVEQFLTIASAYEKQMYTLLNQMYLANMSLAQIESLVNEYNNTQGIPEPIEMHSNCHNCVAIVMKKIALFYFEMKEKTETLNSIANDPEKTENNEQKNTVELQKPRGKQRK